MSTFTTVQTMNKHMSVASLSESLADLSLPPPPAPSTAPYHFTASEMAAFRATRALLVSRGVSADRLSAHEIAITTMNQKLRTDDAADKYMAWLDAINVFGLKSFDEVKGDWSDFNSTLAPMFQSYSPCGRDASGRDIFWINGSRPVKVEEEREAVRAGCLYFLAIHSDPVSLRNGITFVIDVGHNRPNVGNEKKMQKVWQAFPLRPQRILIAGAGTVKRLFINGLIKFASLFSKAKVLQRINFVNREAVVHELGDSVPAYYHTAGFTSPEPMAAWVKERVQAFPVLDLSS